MTAGLEGVPQSEGIGQKSRSEPWRHISRNQQRIDTKYLAGQITA
jgi:hypothetical protein